MIKQWFQSLSLEGKALTQVSSVRGSRKAVFTLQEISQGDKTNDKTWQMHRNDPNQKLDTFNRRTLAVDHDALGPTSNEWHMPKLHYTTLHSEKLFLQTQNHIQIQDPRIYYFRYCYSICTQKPKTSSELQLWWAKHFPDDAYARLG